MIHRSALLYKSQPLKHHSTQMTEHFHAMTSSHHSLAVLQTAQANYSVRTSLYASGLPGKLFLRHSISAFLWRAQSKYSSCISATTDDCFFSVINTQACERCAALSAADMPALQQNDAIITTSKKWTEGAVESAEEREGIESERVNELG